MAAIRLYAEQGANSVSLREINRESGTRNNSALHHYFGSKLGLIEAVIVFIQNAFDEAREAELAELEREAKGRIVSLREVLQVYIQPYVIIIRDYPWGLDAVRTLTRFEFDENDEVRNLLAKSTGKTVKRLQKLIRQSLPNVPRKTLDYRLNFFANAIITGFADYNNLSRTYLGNLSGINLENLSDVYLDLMEAGLSAK